MIFVKIALISIFISFVAVVTVLLNQTQPVLESAHEVLVEPNEATPLTLVEELATTAEKEIAQPDRVGAYDNQDQKKQAFFENRNNRISRDALGNTVVEISTKGFNSREFIVSDWPIYYPDESQLNEGVQGCSSGGYFVDVQATYSLVVARSPDVKVYHYKCSYDQVSDQYLLTKHHPSSSILASIENIRVSMKK